MAYTRREFGLLALTGLTGAALLGRRELPTTIEVQKRWRRW
jgi:hypothetical protein